jgi:putative heme-binding domain-containing protein
MKIHPPKPITALGGNTGDWTNGWGEPIAAATSDGKLFNGVLRGETADELRLATCVNQEAQIARREIEEIRPSTVSIMPAGLDQHLSPHELADLVAFLKSSE